MTGQCKFDGNLFCFFLPPTKKEERNPTHKTAHLQTAQADTRSKFAKELFSCLHTAINDDIYKIKK